MNFNSPIKLSGNVTELTLGTQTYTTLFRGNGQYTISVTGFLGLKTASSGTVYYHPLPLDIGFYANLSMIIINRYSKCICSS